MEFISERIEKTTERWRGKYGGALGDFLGGVISKGGQEFFENQEPHIKDMMRETLENIRDNPKAPPELKRTLDSALGSEDIFKTLSGWIWGILGWIPAILSSGSVQAKLIQYDTDALYRSYRLDPIGWIDAWRKDPSKANEFLGDMADLGISDERLDILKLVAERRLDPASVITAWRRDPDAYAGLFKDLKDQGWSEERIEALKFVTLFYPAPADLVRWQAREVFEPAMVTKYGLDDELEGIEKEPFYKAGMTDEQITNYWRAHWEHASWLQVVEMVRRGQLTEKDLWDWFRLVEIPPFWRDKLIAISWEVPTRVDVRRFYDMGTIDEARLREIYTARGYHGKDLDDYVLWTKVYVAFPDLLARWKNGWITIEEVKAELTRLGMPGDRADELIETKIKAAQPERTANERDITKTDIIKGVKTNVITRAEGVELLIDLGYSEDESVYILEINIPMDEEEVVEKKRQLTKADILKGLKTEVITLDEARDKLSELRYSPPDVELILDIYQAAIKPPEEPKLREASKADIVLGVKKGLITQKEGYGMLLDIGFSPEASDFILMVKIEESPFSPINYPEFKDLTQKWRRSAGMEAKPMTEEIKKAAAEVIRLTKDVETLAAAIKEEQAGLVGEEVLPEAATKRLKGLQVKKHRAESELARAKSEYDRLVAEWKHGTTETESP